MKGLEYENIVLYRFVSGYRREFYEITAGVTQLGLETNTVDYRRARDKSDKSLEVYKFFVNALYGALTRAVTNLYLIETDTAHPLFSLLGLTAAGGEAQVRARQSSLEEWQKEVRKLERQGKQEQAEAIRRTILKQTSPPWSVLTGEKPRWGTQEARREAMIELQRRIDKSRERSRRGKNEVRSTCTYPALTRAFGRCART